MKPEILRRLAALSLAPEVMTELLAIIADVQAADEDRRAKQRDRKRRQRSRDSHGTSVTSAGQSRDSRVEPQAVLHGHAQDPQPVVPEERDQNSPLSFLPSLLSLEDSLEKRGSEDPRARSNLRAEFDEWYSGYPHKVEKKDAFDVFIRVRKSGIPLETLTAGRDRYIQDKPPEIHWCNPAKWLRRERWNDQPAMNGGANGKRGRSILDAIDNLDFGKSRID